MGLREGGEGRIRGRAASMCGGGEGREREREKVCVWAKRIRFGDEFERKD
jgi:hypothetical protein